MDRAIPFYEDILRGYKAIALYYFGTEAEWRKICHLCTTGRFPHFREGAGKICARKTTIDRFVALQEVASMQGKRLTPEDVAKFFGPCAGKDIPKPTK